MTQRQPQPIHTTLFYQDHLFFWVMWFNFSFICSSKRATWSREWDTGLIVAGGWLIEEPESWWNFQQALFQYLQSNCSFPQPCQSRSSRKYHCYLAQVVLVFSCFYLEPSKQSAKNFCCSQILQIALSNMWGPRHILIFWHNSERLCTGSKCVVSLVQLWETIAFVFFFLYFIGYPWEFVFPRPYLPGWDMVRYHFLIKVLPCPDLVINIVENLTYTPEGAFDDMKMPFHFYG